MKPHPRLRKTIKWTGAAVTALLVVAWIGSGWYRKTGMSRDGLVVGIGSGCVVAMKFNARGLAAATDSFGSDPVGYFDGVQPFHIEWWYHSLGANAACSWHVLIPLWMFFAPPFLVWYTAWRLDTLARRRARLALCPTCRYDRTGLAPGAVCPECGAAAARAHGGS